MIVAWTDGSCKGNPGKGGYAAYITYGKHKYAVCGSNPNTTNNRMELEGFIAALESARDLKVDDIVIYTDSKYIENAINCGWLRKWIGRSFEGIKNPDLWSSVANLMKGINPEVRWVKGHSSSKENAIADKIATDSADGLYGRRSVVCF